jgi:dsDNA-specific endonuclease/ATPase MutS2
VGNEGGPFEVCRGEMGYDELQEFLRKVLECVPRCTRRACAAPNEGGHDVTVAPVKICIARHR